MRTKKGIEERKWLLGQSKILTYLRHSSPGDAFRRRKPRPCCERPDGVSPVSHTFNQLSPTKTTTREKHASAKSPRSQSSSSIVAVKFEIKKPSFATLTLAWVLPTFKVFFCPIRWLFWISKRGLQMVVNRFGVRWEENGFVAIQMEHCFHPPIAVLELLAAASVEGDPGRVATLWRNGYLFGLQVEKK